MRSGKMLHGKSPRGTRGRGKGKGVHAVRQDAAGKSPRGAERCGKGKGAHAVRQGAAGKSPRGTRGCGKGKGVRMRSGEVPQGKRPRGTRGRGKGEGLKGEETGEKRKDNVEASDIATAGSCQRSGRTFVPV